MQNKSKLSSLLAVALIALVPCGAIAAEATATDASAPKAAAHKVVHHKKHHVAAAKAAPKAVSKKATAPKAAAKASKPMASKAAAPMAVAAAAPSTAAVSGLNGSLDVRGGGAGGHMMGMVAGKVTAPVTHDFGVQFDGAYGGIGERAVSGVAAHAFYRNPSQILLGGTYQRGWSSGLHYNRFGAEGEYYMGKLTAAARAGFQNGNMRHGEYTNLDLNWYLNDNLVVTPGFRNVAGQVWGRLGTEWQPEAFKVAPGMSVFASTGAGNHGYAFGLVGVRYYFGNDKTLVRRHREDDPAELVPEDSTENFSQFKAAQPIPVGSDSPPV